MLLFTTEMQEITRGTCLATRATITLSRAGITALNTALSGEEVSTSTAGYAARSAFLLLAALPSGTFRADLSTTELSELLSTSPVRVSQALTILENAGLISRVKVGNRHDIRINPAHCWR